MLTRPITLIFFALLSFPSNGFQIPASCETRQHLFNRNKPLRAADDDGNNGERNPAVRAFKELADMATQLDDVMDDFFNKRMGQGEVFYGKRKYKPSGRPNTEGKYMGMGISDPARIEVAKALKEERLEAARLRRENEASAEY